MCIGCFLSGKSIDRSFFQGICDCPLDEGCSCEKPAVWMDYESQKEFLNVEKRIIREEDMKIDKNFSFNIKRYHMGEA